MANRNKNEITVPSHNSGMIHNLVVRTKLILRLLGDPRISFWAKIIPIGAVVYVLSPLDLIMGVPGLDALDDAAVIGLGYYFFIEMCPPGVVQEHLKAIEESGAPKSGDDDIVDAESTDVK